MSISLDTIRSLDAGSSYYLANSTGDIKVAGRWQRFKCWLGVGDGRAKAARLVEAVKTAFLESAGLKGEAALDAEIGALDTRRSISGGALKQIATRFSVSNAEKIASHNAGLLAGLSIGESVNTLKGRGACDDAAAPHVRDLLRRAVAGICANPPMIVNGGRRVLDVVALNVQFDAALAKAEQMVVDVVAAKSAKVPKWDSVYAEYVKNALWNADGTETGVSVADLKDASQVRFEAVKTNATAIYQKAGKDVATADSLIRAALNACDDPDALEVVLRHIERIVVRADAKLRSVESIAQNVEALCRNFAELRQLAANDPVLFRHGKKMLSSFEGASLPEGMLTKLVQSARGQPLAALKGLSENSSGMAIFRALKLAVMAFTRVGKESGMEKVMNGPEMANACAKFIANVLFDRLEPKDLHGLKAAMLSGNAAKLKRNLNDAESGYLPLPEGTADEIVDGARQACMAYDSELGRFAAYLCDRFGEEFPGIAVVHEDVFPEDYGAQGLEDELVELGRETFDNAKAGYVSAHVKGDCDAAKNLGATIMAKLDCGLATVSAEMNRRLQKIVMGMVNRAVMKDMKKIASGKQCQFNIDLKRIDKVTLDGVGVLDITDLSGSKDKFAVLVTKRQDAKYAGLSAAEKKKADFVMAFATQSVLNAIVSGASSLYSDNGYSASFTAVGGKFTFAIDIRFEDGSLFVNAKKTHMPTNIATGGDMKMSPCGQGSKVEHSIDIVVRSHEFDRLMELDFAHYDDAPLVQFVDIERQNDCLENALDHFPTEFKMDCEISADWHADLK